MTTATLTLTEFLLARIADDEAAALTAADGDLGDWEYGQEHFAWQIQTVKTVGSGPDYQEHVAITHDREGLSSSVADYAGPHIERHDPTRVLAECVAKRRIVEAHELVSDVVPVHSGPTPGVGCETCHTVTASSINDVDYVEALGPCDTLLALASVYADHPDFREEWR